MGDELALRAGDADRERVAVALRQHHLDGRLDADELEERIGRAYAARTLDELAALQRDLPAVAAGPAVPVERPKVGWFGLLGFTQVHDLPVGPEEAYENAVELIAGAMVGYGFRLVEDSPGKALTFECEERPGWAYLVAVGAFPFGLLALTARRTARVRVAFVPRPGGTCRLRVSGEARRPVRKAFAQLSG